MASKYENQMKVIGGLEFTSHEYKNKKLRVTVQIGKTIYQHFIYTQTWKNAKDSKQSTFNRLSWRFKKYFKVIKEEIQSYLPAIYNPVQKDFLGKTLQECWDRIMEEANHLLSVKEVHQWFKKYIKYYHPDMLGRKQTFDEEISFNILVEIRDYSIHMIREMEEAFGIKLD